jgi:hypothetical protein
MDCVTNNNSIWVHKYAYYSKQVMSRIDSMKNDETPEPICVTEGIAIESDTDILNMIRILQVAMGTIKVSFSTRSVLMNQPKRILTQKMAAA